MNIKCIKFNYDPVDKKPGSGIHRQVKQLRPHKPAVVFSVWMYTFVNIVLMLCLAGQLHRQVMDPV